MQIYLARNNQQAGPYTLEQLNQMLTSQQVLLTDLAWHQGMTEWKALGELTQGKLVYTPEGYSTPAAFPEPSPLPNSAIRKIQVEKKLLPSRNWLQFQPVFWQKLLICYSGYRQPQFRHFS